MVAMMFWYGGHWAFWQAGLMWVSMIAFWGMLIWGIYVLIRGTTRKPGGEHGDEVRRILDERLARGEIDPAEYRRLCDVIGSEGSGSPVSSRKAS